MKKTKKPINELTAARQCIRKEKAYWRTELTYFLYASDKWITSKIWCTGTNWIVIDNLTTSILSACAWARILALLVHTCLILCTFWTDYTFRATIRCRANEIWQTRAYSMIVDFATLTIRSTGRWYARLNILFCCDKICAKWIIDISA